MAGLGVNNCVDYGQTAEDHRSLIVLVRHAGSGISSQMFNRAYEKISKINGIHVEGQKRNIVINYRKSYSTDFNSWGDFQAHRKVLGLVSIGKCSDQSEFDGLFTRYKRIKEEYSSSIINSRFIVFGLNTDGTPICDSQADNNNETIGDDDGVSNRRVENENVDDSTTAASPNAINNNNPSSNKQSANNGSLAPLAEQEEDSEIDQVDHHHLKPPAVVDKLDNVKKTQGASSPRTVAKHQRSNSLTKESSGAEIVFYPGLDKCADFEDRIKEFVTSLYFVLEGKRLDRSFERNDKLTLPCAPFERKDYVGVDTDTKSFRKKCMGRLRKHLGDLCLQASMPGEAILHYNTALDLLKSVNDFLWMAGCLEGLCCTSIILSSPKASQAAGLRRNFSFQSKGSALNVETKARAGSSSYANGLDTLADAVPHQIMNQDDVIDKFKEAITYYSKFKNAAVIEMETSLKACRFLIFHRRYLQASDFLQNVVYINLPSQEDDKIQRYNTLSSLYNQIGFRRKAAFFKRISGMHCTVPDSSPNWSQCYDLLLQCLDGYNLSVNPREMEPGHPRGWPVLQSRVLHELVFAARRTNRLEVAIRHKTLLVHRMLPFMSVADQREALGELAALTSKCPSDTASTKPLALGHGPILPPVLLYSLPSVRSFKLVAPSPHLQPHKLQQSGGGDDSGSGGGLAHVFIYTPLSLSSSKADDSRPDFKWVCGDVCEATLQVSNPLVDELKISKMALVTSELETEVICNSPVIPPAAKSFTVNLRARPKEPGTLKVQGYSSSVFGVKSNCRLRELSNLKPSPLSEISIQVIPHLPQIAVSCSLPKSLSVASAAAPASSSAPQSNKSTTSSAAREGRAPHEVDTGSVVLFAGQSVECVVTLKNTSEVPLESARVWLEGKGDLKGVLSRMIVWSEENIASQLPLQPSHTLCFSLCINGDSDFLSPTIDVHRSPASSSRPRSESSLKRSLEASLCLEYSGGEGLKAGYCRKCSLGLKIHILPSVCISKWDVQATDRPSHCRLCLDLVNTSGQQLTLHYGNDLSVSLEALQTKRIGLEVLRLDPTQIDSAESTSEDVDRNQGRIPPIYSSSPLHSVPDPYSQCMAAGLDIRWNMVSKTASGKVHVDYLKWNPEQLSVLLLSQMRWTVCLNGHQFSTSFKPRFDIGQPVELAVNVETSEDAWPRDACLCVQVLQTHASRSDLPLESGSYAVIGSPVHLVNKPSQEEAAVEGEEEGGGSSHDHRQPRLSSSPSPSKISHTCSFSFFYAGWYHFNICFIPVPPSSNNASSSSSPPSSVSPSPSSSSIPSPPSLAAGLSSTTSSASTSISSWPPQPSSSTSYSKYVNNNNNGDNNNSSNTSTNNKQHQQQIRTQQPPTSLLSPVSAPAPSPPHNNNNNNNNDNSSSSSLTSTTSTASSSSPVSSLSASTYGGSGGGGTDNTTSHVSSIANSSSLSSSSSSSSSSPPPSSSSNNNNSNDNNENNANGRSGGHHSNNNVNNNNNNNDDNKFVGGVKNGKRAAVSRTMNNNKKAAGSSSCNGKGLKAVNPGWYFGSPVRFEIS